MVRVTASMECLFICLVKKLASGKPTGSLRNYCYTLDDIWRIHEKLPCLRTIVKESVYYHHQGTQLSIWVGELDIK